MAYFVVTRERGPAWDGSRPMDEQEGWAEHAAFMNSLVADGFVVLGGPVGDGTKIVLIINADSQEAIRQRLAADTWSPMGLLRVATVERWDIRLGDPG